MNQREVDARFDEIVYLSGVEHLLDVPVKRCSCGMEVRLAISVAVSLRTHILLLDEAVCVGDAALR
jgi:teichoic acid transport system ATP-binding protein